MLNHYSLCSVSHATVFQSCKKALNNRKNEHNGTFINYFLVVQYNQATTIDTIHQKVFKGMSQYFHYPIPSKMCLFISFWYYSWYLLHSVAQNGCYRALNLEPWRLNVLREMPSVSYSSHLSVEPILTFLLKCRFPLGSAK